MTTAAEPRLFTGVCPTPGCKYRTAGLRNRSAAEFRLARHLYLRHNRRSIQSEALRHAGLLRPADADTHAELRWPH